MATNLNSATDNMTKDYNVIVLSAGKIQTQNLSSSMVEEEGMLPVRGKPSLVWSVDSLFKNNFSNINVVLRKTNSRLKRLLEFYFEKINIVNFDETKYQDTILSSLKQGLDGANIQKPTLVLLGDSFINGIIPNCTDFVLTSNNFSSSSQWCLVSKNNNGEISDIYDKVNDITTEGKEVLVGCYCFSDTKLLNDILNSSIKNRQREISDLLNQYRQHNTIKAIRTDDWYDFGHAHGATQARLALFNAREFNDISVNQQTGTIFKKSSKKQKLLDEINWYNSLPKEISALAPRVIKVEETQSDITIEMEMYGYPNLAELFLYGQNNIEDWTYILDRLLNVYSSLKKFKQKSNIKEQEEIYINKTKDRIGKMREDAFFDNLLNQPTISINGKQYKNYISFEGELLNNAKKIINSNESTIVHGDFCFSNILYDSMHSTFRLIDPRGRFLEQSIYGDSRYDIAKLRHSVVGLYDFVVAGLYKINQKSEKDFDLNILSSDFNVKLGLKLDELIKQNGYNLEEIKLIEMLLFLTMIPFHSDSKNRQLAFYLISVMKANEVFNLCKIDNLEFAST